MMMRYGFDEVFHIECCFCVFWFVVCSGIAHSVIHATSELESTQEILESLSHTCAWAIGVQSWLNRPVERPRCRSFVNEQFTVPVLERDDSPQQE